MSFGLGATVHKPRRCAATVPKSRTFRAPNFRKSGRISIVGSRIFYYRGFYDRLTRRPPILNHYLRCHFYYLIEVEKVQTPQNRLNKICFENLQKYRRYMLNKVTIRMGVKCYGPLFESMGGTW